MTVYEALDSCRNGNFLTHRYFDNKQSMHYFEGQFFYEDGCNLSNQMDWFTSEKCLQDGWSIKFTKDNIDVDKLIKLHANSRGLMLGFSSYEECIKVTPC